jgi:short-subunit dehydrogenase
VKPEEIQWALITGATSGIGEQLSYLLAGKAINLIIHGRDNKRLQALSEKLSAKVQIETVCADLALPQQRQLLVDKIYARGPELIINNAGFGLYGDALTYSVDRQLEILEVNGNAVLELTLEGARALIGKGRKGVVCNVASTAAFPVFPRLAVYGAAKSFVVHFSQSLDEETKPFGVRILAACPGMVDTNFRLRAGGGSGSDKAMTSEFAAEAIWRQITKEKKIYIFNNIYRLMIFFVRHLLPKQWVAAMLKANIDRRHPPQPLKLDRN